MTVYLDMYFEQVEKSFRRIRETQLRAIKDAAGAVAQSLANQGALLIMDTGHMLRYEAFFRAGGMMAVAPFSYELKLDNPVDQRKVERSSEEQAELERQLASVALDQSKMRHGDVLIINSNSGRTPNVIEVALQCKGRGITTIGISSGEQMDRCEAAHPSGKKLFDVADICIDTCGPFGDAAVPVRDNEPMCPMSGLAATYVYWAIHAEAVEQLQDRGINPSIFRSVHVSGLEFIEEQRKKFLEKGI
ncbi:MAG: hypothetical protein AMXMBFR82_24350 [Candidatus Hydrogenedentota bacterium]